MMQDELLSLPFNLKLQTVAQLKIYLSRNNLSPESFAKKAKISNMTIRRLLKKSYQSKIPAKYHAVMNGVVNSSLPAEYRYMGQLFSYFFQSLEKSGETLGDEEHLNEELKKRLAIAGESSDIEKKIGFLKGIIRDPDTSERHRALSVGALVHFVSPSHSVPGLDEIAVLSLVTSFLKNVMLNEDVKEGLRTF